jgi:hypothetical protein
MGMKTLRDCFAERPRISIDPFKILCQKGVGLLTAINASNASKRLS